MDNVLSIAIVAIVLGSSVSVEATRAFSGVGVMLARDRNVLGVFGHEGRGALLNMLQLGAGSGGRSSSASGFS